MQHHEPDMGNPVMHEGRVRYRSGEFAAGAIVAVQRGTAPTPEIAIRCDAKGGFHIALPQGRYDIEARAHNGEFGTVSVATGSEAQIIEIVLNEER
jgi:Carboxypeptidase regulatory-like domain